MELGQGANVSASQLDVESEEVYVVYHGETGAIAHIHRVVNHRGATPVAGSAETRALELAEQFGHRGKEFRVLRSDDFDVRVAQRVDLKKSRVIADRPTPEKPAKSRPRAKK